MMTTTKNTSVTLDKAFSIILIACVLFWFLAKVEALHRFVLFGVFYEMFVLLSIPLLAISTLYFLYRSFVVRFSLSQPPLFLFLLGVAGVVVMRFVEVFKCY